jgi:TPR repeat protein
LFEREKLEAAAAAGDAGAQARMGDACRIGGEFGEVDLKEAVRWYRLAAEQGNPHGQTNLGAMYQHGMGVPKDVSAAVNWYRLAAAQDFPVAQHNLGMAYLRGRGVETNPEEAIRWIKAAAHAGYGMAQYEMGYLLLQGIGVDRDLARSAEFFILAARQEHRASLGNLCDMQDALRRLAISGNKNAAWCLKQMYESGLGVPRNEKASRRWGKLFVAVENMGRDLFSRVHLNEEGNVERDSNEIATWAPGDDPYSLEWLYQTGAAVETVDQRQRAEYLEYRVKRDAGMPGGLDALWPEDDWQKWKAP